ncbi:MAG: hypothetical protein QG649_595 [Patescibacteria group bacterium]|jgi:hypothetical protein|nr:hypothetical protein [Patescibacteria group bacterium]
MGEAYELDGQLFTTVGEFLDAAGHEYKHGDKDLAVQTLEDYGFSLSDINAAGHQPHPTAVRDDAHAVQDNGHAHTDDTKEEE